MDDILDGIPGGSILEGLDDWPATATRQHYYELTRQLVASTIAQMDLPVLSALNCGYIFRDSLLQKCVKYLEEKNC